MSVAQASRLKLTGAVGVALGSGAARGWAHVGVLRGLLEHGIEPTVVAGTSIGAVVGGAYAAGALDRFEQWVMHLDRRQIAAYLDVRLRGGLVRARKVFEAMAAEIPDCDIASLPLTFAAVATDLATGNEVWLRRGGLYDALRASVALPGLVSPVRSEGRWLVDGGLVNPVPVSVCRALGADSVIGVDLNTALVGRRFREVEPDATVDRREEPDSAPPGGFDHVRAAVQRVAGDLRQRLVGEPGGVREPTPSILDVVANSINIMQIRVTRSRMAGDPPDILVAPRLRDFGLFDFDRAGEAVEEGRRAVAQALEAYRGAQ
jgi:NTE family protein